MEAQQSDPSKYDLASVVMINLDTKGESEQPILNFLEILLSNTKEPAEKKQALLAGYGIETTSEMDKEMNDMCNLSQGIAEENRAAGVAIGEEKKARESAQNMYNDGVRVEKIAQYLGYAVDTVKRWVGLMPAYAAREE